MLTYLSNNHSQIKSIRWALLSFLLCVLPGSLSADPATNALPVHATDFIESGTITSNIGSESNLTRTYTVGSDAVVNFSSHDIGANAKVEYLGDASHRVIGRIADTQASQIFGQLDAQVNLILLNQHGFLFGPDSVVNVNSLTASALNMSSDSIANGINNLDAKDQADFVPFESNGEKVYSGVIQIQNGASISAADEGSLFFFAPASVINHGDLDATQGQINLVAGSKIYLSQPTGEESHLLVAIEITDEHIQAIDEFNAHVTASDQLPIAQVQNGDDGVDHSSLTLEDKLEQTIGRLFADRGVVSLLGASVNNSGVISAQTSIEIGGKVYLTAASELTNTITYEVGNDANRSVQDEDLNLIDLSYYDIGKVELGADSVVTTSPDLNDNSTTIEDSAAPQPQGVITLFGQTIELAERSSLISNGGQINIDNKRSTLEQLELSNLGDLSSGDEHYSITIADSALVDVSGLHSTADMSRNIVEVEFLSNEVKDSPLLKNDEALREILLSNKLKVDARQLITHAGTSYEGTAVADISGFIDLIEDSVELRSVFAGEISIHGRNTLDIAATATLDVSGGSITYQDGMLDVSSLLDANGNVVSLNDALPNRDYDDIYTGLNPASEYIHAGYVEGKSAGAIVFNTQQILSPLDADIIKADIIAGPYQLQPTPSDITLRSNRPSLWRYRPEPASITIGNVNPDSQYKRVSQVIIDSTLTPVNSETVVVRPDLLAQLGEFNVAASDSIVLSSDINMPAGAQLALTAPSIQLDNTVRIPSGEIDLETTDPRDDVANIVSAIDINADIDLAGLQLDSNASLTQVHYLDGGAISLSNVGTTTIDSSVDIDLSAGISVQLSNGSYDFMLGSAGSIELDIDATGGAGTSNFDLHEQFHAYGATVIGQPSHGGSFVLAIDDNICISSNQCSFNQSIAANDYTQLVTQLSHDFIENYGFTSIELQTSTGELVIDSQIDFNPLVRQFSYSDNEFTTSLVEPATIFNHSTNLQLAATSDLTLTDSSVLTTTANSNIDLSSDRALYFGGQLTAPASEVGITVTNGAEFANFSTTGASEFNPGLSIWLADNSLINVDAIDATQVFSDITVGQLYDAGSITLAADRSYIVVNPTAKLSAKAAAGSSRGYDNNGRYYVRDTLAAAGSISLTSAERILMSSDGNNFDLSAAAEQQHGGKLTITLDQTDKGGDSNDIDQAKTHYTRHSQILLSSSAGTTLPADLDFGDAIELSGTIDENVALTTLYTQQIDDSGASNLHLKALDDQYISSNIGGENSYSLRQGQIAFQDGLQLNLAGTLVLDASEFIMPTTGSPQSANIQAHAVRMGTSDIQYNRITPSRYTDLLESDDATVFTIDSPDDVSTLNMTANVIDVFGDSVYNNIAHLNLNSRNEIRFVGLKRNRNALISATVDPDDSYFGTTDIIGSMQMQDVDLSLTAEIIYPTTLSDFEIINSGVNSFISTSDASSVTALTPYSLAASLAITARQIDHSGHIIAPEGRISLTGDQTSGSIINLHEGSSISVSGGDSYLPFADIVLDQFPVFQLNSSGLESIDSAAELVFDKDNLAVFPAKNLAMDAETITIETDALIDLSATNNIVSNQFNAGLNGTRDIINLVSAADRFVLAPSSSLDASAQPVDPSTDPDFSPDFGETITLLSDAYGLSAGSYVKLPPHYALLPEHVLFEEVSGYGHLQAGEAITSLYGDVIVPSVSGDVNGKVVDQRVVGIRGMDATAILAQANYTSYNFADVVENSQLSVALPTNAGRAAITSNNLTLQGTFSTNHAADYLGGSLDITSSDIFITDAIATNSRSGYLNLSADELNNLNLESLMLGGTRNNSGVSQGYTISSDRIELDDGVSLDLQELILVSNLDLTFGQDIEISTTQTVEELNEAYITTSDAGNIFLISGNNAWSYTIESAAENTASPSISTGANLSLEYAGSALFGTTDTLDLSDSLAASSSQGALTFVAPTLRIGESAAANSQLAASMLDQVDVKQISLLVSDVLHIESDTNITAQSLLIQSPVINVNNASSSIPTTATFTLTDSLTLIGADAQSYSNSTEVGELTFDVGQHIIFAGDAITFTGLSSAELNTSRIQLLADTDIELSGDLNLIYTDMDAGNAFDFSVAAGGSIATQRATKAALSETTQSYYNLVAFDAVDEIDWNSALSLNSGLLALTSSTSAVVFKPLTEIDLSGTRTSRFNDDLATDGGRLSVAALQDIEFQTPASSQQISIDVSAATGANAGSISLTSQTGNVSIANASITANSQQAQRAGDLSITTESQTSADFEQLLHLANEQGLSNQVYYRVGDGDISMANTQTLQAHAATLVADTGNITINGTINALGDRPYIGLFASDDLTLSDTADISLSQTGDNPYNSSLLELSSSSGTVSILDGHVLSAISEAGQASELRIFAPLNSVQTGIDLLLENHNITGFDSITALATKQYNYTDLSADTLTAIKTDLATFESNVDSIAANLSATGTVVDVTAGVEIYSHQGLTISQVLDFSDWRYGSKQLAPHVTFRAVGDITIGSDTDAAVISDGSDDSGILDDVSSASFKLVAGADLSSAHSDTILASQQLSGGGNLTIYPGQEASMGALEPVQVDLLYFGNVLSTNLFSTYHSSYYGVVRDDLIGTETELTDCGIWAAGKSNSVISYQCSGGPSSQPFIPSGIRTGTGDITIVTAGDIEFIDQTASIYTTGRNLGDGYLLDGLNRIKYGEQGGDISINTAGDIIGADYSGFINQWHWKTDAALYTQDDGTVKLGATGWTSNQESFSGDIATFGGGSIDIHAQGALHSIDVSVATSGKQTNTAYVSQRGSNESTFTPIADSIVEVVGGGNLNIFAAGSITEPRLYIGQGEAHINSDQSLGSAAGLGGLVMLADADVDIAARKDLYVNKIFNPSIAELADNQLALECIDCPALTVTESYFFSYGDQSNASLTSFGGDVNYTNNNSDLSLLLYGEDNSSLVNSRLELTVLPQSIRFESYNGDVIFGDAVNTQAVLFAHDIGGFELIAANDVIINSALLQSDLSDDLLPLVTAVSADLEEAQVVGLDSSVRLLLNTQNIFGVSADSTSALANNTLKHAASPRHGVKSGFTQQDNARSSIVANNGSVIFTANMSVGVVTAEPLAIIAKQDIENPNIYIQSNNEFDVSTISSGTITGTLDLNELAYISQDTVNTGIRIDGPGRLDVITESDIDLGVSEGIISRGNIFNNYLDATPADLNVLVGFSQYEQRINEFAAQYITSSTNLDHATTLLAQYAALANQTYGAAISDKDTLANYAAAYQQQDNLAAPFKGLAQDQLMLLDNYGVNQTATADELIEVFNSLDALYRGSVVYDVFNQEIFAGATAAAFATQIGLGTAGFYAGFQRSFDAIEVLYPEHVAALELLHDEISLQRVGIDTRNAELVSVINDLTDELLSLPTYLDYVDLQIADYETNQVAYDSSDVRTTIRAQVDSGDLLTYETVIGQIQQNISEGIGLQAAINTPLSDAGLNPVMTSQAAVFASSANTISGAEIVAEVQALQVANDSLFQEDVANLITPFNLIGGTAGANVNIQVPFGYYNAGEAVDLDALNLVKTAGELGVISGGGSVEMFLGGDLLVNLQRVVGIGREALNLYSLFDNIDAGSGAKTTISSRIPAYSFSNNANRSIIFPTSFTGSGIRKLNDDNGDTVSPNLATPYGVLDAGDAGILGDAGLIRSSADVENGSQIDAGSGAGGGDTTAPTVAAPTVDASASTAASNSAESSSSSPADEEQQAQTFASDAAAFLNVFVLGVGDEESDEKEKRAQHDQKLSSL